MTGTHERGTRLAELIAALSLATDLGMGQPMEQALRTCLLSMRAGQQLELDAATLSDTYYLALLRFVGCTADTHESAIEVGGDEIAYRAGLAPILMGSGAEFMRFMLRHFAEDTPPLTRMRLLTAALAGGTGAAKRTIATHCEVARMLPARIGLSDAIGQGVGHIFERWDGKGLPGELAGEAIPIGVRVVAVARDVEVLQRLGGWAFTAETVRQRRVTAYDPAVADVFLEHGERWLLDLDADATWDAVMAAEPAPQATIRPGRIDEVLAAFADFADLKSPFTLAHSRRVAQLAEDAAQVIGLDAPHATDLRRAALVHDLGRTGIPNGIWDKPSPLSDGEWERVRLHPYYSERILSRSAALQHLAHLAGSHHERLDGSGYHRASPATLLPIEQRILAAADAYQAMTQPRPHRPALSDTSAAAELRNEVSQGRLDHAAAQAVLEAAGFGKAAVRGVWPAGLTEREVEVLRMISRGSSNRIVAEELHVSAKTVGRHVENIYIKIGVSSRAAAALFSMEHGLI